MVEKPLKSMFLASIKLEQMEIDANLDLLKNNLEKGINNL